ncbi:hypothetical protein GYA28_02520 [Candidatus Roizmanbacteria bacterium]|nr:hypothetical protein [Candidatus Roizmanbacteria bacterium]
MGKGVAILPIVFVILAFGLGLGIGVKILSPRLSPSTNPPQAINSKVQVPLPSGEDTIRTFFNLIQEKKPNEALKMLTVSYIGNDCSRTSWLNQFKSFENVSVDKIDLENGSSANGKKIYKVTISARMLPTATSAPIPNYGWENGQNVRWITLSENNKNIWKIAGISTGP